MKKRLSTILLICYMAFALCACGSSTVPSAATQPAQPGQAATPQSSQQNADDWMMNPTNGDFWTFEELKEMILCGRIDRDRFDMMMAAGVVDPDADYHGLYDMMAMPDNESAEYVDSEPTAKLEGLIILIDSNDGVYFNHDIEVVCLNPFTGEQSTVSSWPVWRQMGAATQQIAYILANCEQKYSTSYREWFSNDYSLFACTQITMATQETHAGWIDQQGFFYDTTAELGLLPSSDFADPVHYLAEGFHDGEFVFWNRDTDTYYHVPIDNVALNAVNEGNPIPIAEFPNPTYPDFNISYPVSCWIDETTCLIDDYTTPPSTYRCNSFIADLATKTLTGYISGSSRYNLCGVLSPDKQNVAFLSKLMTGEGSTELFMMPFAGGDPVRIENNLPFSKERGHSRPVTHYSHGAGETFLGIMEWR